MAILNDLTGKTFGNWKVLYRNGSTPNKASIWHCRCLLCGSESDVAGYSLTSGSSTKCRSCVPRETLSKPYRKSRLYNIYRGMMQRCYAESNSHFQHYGKRGIHVCEEWYKNPDAFISWALSSGYEDGLSIDRINVNEGYCPENCRWIPLAKQAQNRSVNTFVEYRGERLCLAEACRKADIKYSTVRSYRASHGCTAQEALDHYVRHPCT